MYQILKDKEKKSIMKKTSVYSLLWFSHIYLREGFQNLFYYDKLKEQKHYITDKSLIAVVDKIEELVRALRKHIVRTEI